MGVLTVLLTFFVVKRLTKYEELGLVTAAAVAVDPLVRNLASIALLDIFVTAFTLLAIFFAVSKKYKESLLILGLATTFKFTALLAFIPILLLYISELIERGVNGFTEILNKSIESLLLALLSCVFFQLLVSAPIILKIGLGPWLQIYFAEAISWHLSTKCIGSNCPIASAPWDWFFGINSFPLYIYPGGYTLYAQGFAPAYTLSFILAIFTVAYRFQKSKPLSEKPWVILSGLFSAYLLLWIAGSRTQYSFYAVQLTPFIYIYLVTQIYEFLKRDSVIRVLISWKKFLDLLWQALLLLLG
jgi:predicted membrane-bound dolichyl-phosphate-mannose-protein mannosyltransferase